MTEWIEIYWSQVTNQLRSLTRETIPQRATDATYSTVRYESTIANSTEEGVSTESLSFWGGESILLGPQGLLQCSQQSSSGP